MMRRLVILALIALAACTKTTEMVVVMEEPVMAEPAVMESAAPEPVKAGADTAMRTEICEDIDAGDGIGGTGCPAVE